MAYALDSSSLFARNVIVAHSTTRCLLLPSASSFPKLFIIWIPAPPPESRPPPRNLSNHKLRRPPPHVNSNLPRNASEQPLLYLRNWSLGIFTSLSQHCSEPRHSFNHPSKANFVAKCEHGFLSSREASLVPGRFSKRLPGPSRTFLQNNTYPLCGSNWCCNLAANGILGRFGHLRPFKLIN